MLHRGYHRVDAPLGRGHATDQRDHSHLPEDALLADYLRSLDADELAPAVTFLTGRPFAQRDQRTLGLGWAALVGIVEGLVDAPAGRAGGEYNQSSDLATAVGDLLARTSTSPPASHRRVVEVAPPFSPSRRTRSAKAPLRELLARCDAPTARAIVAFSAASCASACARATSRRASPAASRCRWPTSSGRACSPATSARRPYWPATGRARRGRAGALPAAQVDARLARRRRGRGLQRASAPRSGWRTSTTASAPSCTSRARGAALQRDLQ
jgi:hypothetical protein